MEKRFFKNSEIRYGKKIKWNVEITDYMRNREMIKKNNLLRELVQAGLTFEELQLGNNKKLKFIRTHRGENTLSSSIVFILGILITLGFFNLAI